jgi:hypothetical protein
MSHLTHFGVGNFKVFNELTDFELAPLTILTKSFASFQKKSETKYL